MNKPFVVGLTGGIASGKTAASKRFEYHNIIVVDADIVARLVVAPGTKALSEIQAYFGDHVISSDGTLNRAVLRDIIFTDTGKQTWINNLLHPIIRQEMQAQIERADSAYVILAVPLLIENKLDKIVDRVLVIDLPTELQVSRAVSRDKCDPSIIKNIIDAQIKRELRVQAADDIVVNDRHLSDLHHEIDNLHKNYLTLASKKM